MTRYLERGVFFFIISLVGGLVISVVLYPPQKETAAPKAVLEIPGIDWHESLAKPGAPVDDRYIPQKARGSEVLLDGVAVRALEDRHVASSLDTADILDRTFRQMGYDLDSIRTGETKVPRVFLASMPGDIGKVRESKKRKGLFFKTVLPLVLQVNEEIQKDRERLADLISREKRGVKIGPVDRLWLIVMAERYKTKRGNLKALVERVDIIPPSLALAQAAEESGWGTSRFVREGNAMFGQWTTADSEGIIPKNRDAGKTHKIKAFKSLLHSVRSYARNLNTHRAYRDLRRARMQLRQQGKPLIGLGLTGQLTSYSERGEEYVKTLRTIIGVNKLIRFDDASLIEKDLSANAPSPVTL